MCAFHAMAVSRGCTKRATGRMGSEEMETRNALLVSWSCSGIDHTVVPCRIRDPETEGERLL